MTDQLAASAEHLPAARPPWTWADSRRLELCAIGWLITVTLPVANFVTAFAVGWPTGTLTLGSGLAEAIGGALSWTAWAEAFSGIMSTAAALIVLPATWGLGRLLRGVESRFVQVAASSALAGALASVPIAFARPMFADYTGEVDWAFAIIALGPVPVAAGAAAALARYRQLPRPAPAAP